MISGSAHIITYILLFISLYFEIFVLITYIENRSDINEQAGAVLRIPKSYPSVSIIVPCWNEETTLARTVQSLLALDYPADKLDIILVDDGSKDHTWKVMRTFQSDRVRIFQKPNGGKHTALNLGLTKSSSDLVGCLDADSYVDAQALKNMVLYFEDHPNVSVVTPSMKIWQPKNIIQTAQAVEYMWSIFLRKMYSYLGTIYVTPGPFSVFRRDIFAHVGEYRPAHMTEDMEMAMRLQKHHFVIGHAHTAIVHTSAPDTVKKLYKQRLRWTYGFIRNTADYRDMFFKREYGNLGLFILPMAVLSIISALFIAGTSLSGYVTSIENQITKIRTVGFHLPQMHLAFDWFYINTQIIAVASLVALALMFVILIISRTMSAEPKKGVLKTGPRYALDLVYFMVVYAVLAPIWIFKALYNAAFSVTTQWR